MKRRVRLTESQLRDIVEESSRRVIREMIDEGFFGDVAWPVTKIVASGLLNQALDNWNGGWIAKQTGWKIPNYDITQQAYAKRQQPQQQARNNQSALATGAANGAVQQNRQMNQVPGRMSGRK